MEKHNWNTLRHLTETGAKLTSSEVKIFSIDFESKIATVNIVETYIKRNNKTCYVTDCTKERKIKFTKDDITTKIIKKKCYSNEWCIGDRDEYIAEFERHILTTIEEQKIIYDYKMQIGLLNY